MARCTPSMPSSSRRRGRRAPGRRARGCRRSSRAPPRAARSPGRARDRCAACGGRRCGPRACGVGDDPAVGLAEGAERPVVLADRHAVDERARGGGLGLARARPARSGRAAGSSSRGGRRGRRSGAGRRPAPGRRVARGSGPARAGGPRGLVPRLLVAQPLPVVRRRRDRERRRSPCPRSAVDRAAPARAGSPARPRARRSRARAPRARPPRRSAARRRRRTTDRMYALIPVVSVSSPSCSAQSRGAPSRNPPPLPNDAVDVEQPAHLGRAAAGLVGRAVDGVVHGRQVGEVGIAHARQPAVGLVPVSASMRGL